MVGTRLNTLFPVTRHGKRENIGFLLRQARLFIGVGVVELELAHSKETLVASGISGASALGFGFQGRLRIIQQHHHCGTTDMIFGYEDLLEVLWMRLPA